MTPTVAPSRKVVDARALQLQRALQRGRGDRHRAIDAILNPFLGHHAALAELELKLQEALQSAPVGPD